MFRLMFARYSPEVYMQCLRHYLLDLYNLQLSSYARKMCEQSAQSRRKIFIDLNSKSYTAEYAIFTFPSASATELMHHNSIGNRGSPITYVKPLLLAGSQSTRMSTHQTLRALDLNMGCLETRPIILLILGLAQQFGSIVLQTHSVTEAHSQL